MADPRRRASGDLSNSPVCLSVYGALLLHVSAGARGHFVSATSPLPTQLLLRPRQQRCGAYCDESVGMSLCIGRLCVPVRISTSTSYISGTKVVWTSRNFMSTYGRGLLVVWRCCDKLCISGARFTKYLTTILRLSYDNATVTINLRRTSNLQNSSQWMESFSWVRYTCKIVISSEIVFVN